MKPDRDRAPARHYLTELDLDVDTTRALLDEAARLRVERAGGGRRDDLAGMHVGLYFEKPSVRTRVSFTVGVHELGGQVIELGASNTKVGKGEDVEDFARVMGRYVHGLVARVFAQEKLELMAAHAGVPVVNALSDERHPCQALADVLTMRQHKGRVEGLRVVFVGEGNNVAASTGLLAALLGAEVVVASPAGYGLPAAILEAARSRGASLTQVEDPRAAARGADVLYTDTWISMGQEGEAAERRRLFREHRLDAAALELARPDAVVMHCLPAVPGEEIEADVLRGPRSVVWDQAENRLHAQKALLLHLLAPSAR
jgi:ornithine carbamoyltransferase